jgi:hypothetical protein
MLPDFHRIASLAPGSPARSVEERPNGRKYTVFRGAGNGTSDLEAGGVWGDFPPPTQAHNPFMAQMESCVCRREARLLAGCSQPRGAFAMRQEGAPAWQ